MPIFSTNGVGKNVDLCMQKYETTSCLTRKQKNIELVEESLGKINKKVGKGKDFLDNTPEAQVIKENKQMGL